MILNFDESNERLYHGAGPALCAHDGTRIIDLVYLRDALPGFDVESYVLARAVQDPLIEPSVRALEATGGQVSVGMCSGFTFMEL